MDIRFDGKVALVTGGAVGIGREIALELARSGATIAVNTRDNIAEAAGVIAEVEAMGGKAIAMQADLTKVVQVEAMVAEITAKFGDIAIVVNNVGGLVGRVKIEEMTEEFYDAVMDVNVKSAVFVSKAVIPGFRRLGWGRIINISSFAAHNGGGNGATIYAASKAAVLGFTRGLAKELALIGVTVNAIAPGTIGNTPFHSTHTAPEAYKNMVASIPVGREGLPSDVAAAVVFLASEQASFVTAECLEVNGGQWIS